MQPAADDSTSRTLLERVRRHEAAAWRRFAELYGPLVYRWARSHGVTEHDAADVVQEVFQATFQSLDRFRRESPGDSLRGWLWGITRNKALDHFRRRRDLPAAAGGTEAQARLQQTPELLDQPSETPETTAAEITHRALELIRNEFESSSWQAFLATTVPQPKLDGIWASVRRQSTKLSLGSCCGYVANWRG